MQRSYAGGAYRVWVSLHTDAGPVQVELTVRTGHEVRWAAYAECERRGLRYHGHRVLEV
jgi:hypothetical protein